MAYFRNVTLNIEDFDSQEEYSRALLEQERIQKILNNVDITDAHIAGQLYEGFCEHPEMFRSRVGLEFMDVLRENCLGEATPALESEELSEEAKENEAVSEPEEPESQNSESEQPEELSENVKENEAMPEPEEPESRELESEQPEELSDEVKENEAASEPEELESQNSESEQLEELSEEAKENEAITEPEELESQEPGQEKELAGKEVETEPIQPDNNTSEKTIKKQSVNYSSANSNVNDSANDIKLKNESITQNPVAGLKNNKSSPVNFAYEGLVKWIILLYAFVIVCFPMSGAILAGICAVAAFIKVWGSYINSKMKATDIIKSLLCIVFFPVGLIMSVFGIMKKIKYVYYNRKVILYGFVMYMIPVLFFCNVGIFSKGNIVTLIYPLINVFYNATLLAKIGIILDIIVVIIILIVISMEFAKKLTALIKEYINKGLTQAEAMYFVICMPVIMICMFKAFIDGKILYEDKLS